MDYDRLELAYQLTREQAKQAAENLKATPYLPANKVIDITAEVAKIAGTGYGKASQYLQLRAVKTSVAITTNAMAPFVKMNRDMEYYLSRPFCTGAKGYRLITPPVLELVPELDLVREQVQEQVRASDQVQEQEE